MEGCFRRPSFGFASLFSLILVALVRRIAIRELHIGTAPQNQDGISKALGLHSPFFISMAARFLQTIGYMHLSTTGMMVGVPFSIGGFSWRCMSPVTPGNALGGAILVGLVYSDTYGGRVRQSIGGRMG